VLSRTPHRPGRKVYIGTIHAVLTLQKKYGYAGWFRIQGYLAEPPYNIKLGETTIKKIMALTSQIPQMPIFSRKIRLILIAAPSVGRS
jgi:hypothetical protein